MAAERSAPTKDGGLHSEVYLDFVRALPCAVKTCRAFGVDPHHYPPKGMGGASQRDDHAIPLCRMHHDLAQRMVFTRDEQIAWRDQTMALFVQRASAVQMSAFFVDWMAWREGRGEAVPF